MRDLIILGTGVHAGEMVEIAERVNRARSTWNVLGTVASAEDASRVGKKLNGVRILGTGSVLDDYPSATCVPAFGYTDETVLGRVSLGTLVDPSAFVSRTARVGRGCVIYPGCFVGLNAVVGECVFMLSGSTVNHDDHVEDRVTFASRATLAGMVHVEADCYLGQACTVRQSLRIGRGSMIGMGAVVIRDVPPDSVMAGNPARRLRARTRTRD